MKGMTIIVKKIAEIMCALIFLYGFYIILHGHLSPGGGFGGGAILAGAFILFIIAFGVNNKLLHSKESHAGFIEALGILFFIFLAITALLFSYKLDVLPIFFKNFLSKGTAGKLISAGFIPLLNLFIGIEVGGALYVIFLEFVIKSKEGKAL